MTQDDIRIQRTRRLLTEALTHLIIERGYETVTVREIAKQAQVGYKTFYRHYESKDALLNTVLNELIQGLQQTLTHPSALQTPTDNTIAALQFTQAHADLFLALAQSPVRDKLLGPLMAAALEEGAKYLSHLGVPSEIAIFHFASSIDALIKWWLTQGQAYTVEEMAAYINKLVIIPLQQLAQLERPA